ncbi:glycosyltransferase family 2 protein [Candidatus Woesebacteria bacterium]|nr:glycosyltransferase family 2 protein [Candidatus Woesebacteria bacterium]
MISTVILYKNEKEAINRCLNSLSWCSDIVIVQDSQDAVPELQSHQTHPKIVKRLLDDDFAAQRNFGMQQAKNGWVLFVDPDEELSNELIALLKTLTPDAQIAAYAIPRIDIFWNKRILHGEVGSAARDGILRLVNRTQGTWQGSVHEVFVPKGETSRLGHSLFHYPHPTIGEFLQSVNFYSSLRAREIVHRSHKRLFVEMVFYPPVKFMYTYFIKMGVLDGTAGFVYSFMMSFHSFLVRAKAITKTYDTI